MVLNLLIIALYQVSDSRDLPVQILNHHAELTHGFSQLLFDYIAKGFKRMLHRLRGSRSNEFLRFLIHPLLCTTVRTRVDAAILRGPLLRCFTHGALSSHNGVTSDDQIFSMAMDPLTSLAFTVHSNPGTYAVLLGSGVSTGAGIPTGWSIVLDLIRRLAQLEGEKPGDDELEQWYTNKHGSAPEYTALLETLAKTPAERQGILKGYIEPTDDEREEGLKLPSTAHRALARLAADGFIRVIVTTNFDRLMEQALEEAGVDHDVVASVDAIAGARPLVHTPCLVIKLHGDYRDTRIRNTVGELEKYDEPTDTLLDQVFDNHGLILSGWSATWDPALQDAILRQPNRRYGYFWTTRGDISGGAEKLIKHRDAEVIHIESADQFFTDLSERVQALQDMDTPHPLTVGSAVATLKRLISDPSRRIRLHDVVMDEAERTRAAIADEHFPPNDQGFTQNTWEEYIVDRVARYRAASEVFVNLIAVGCMWSDGEEQDRLWGQALERIANHSKIHAGKTGLLALRKYPALRTMYAGGIAAVHTDHYGALRSLTTDQTFRELNDEVPMAAALHPWRTFEQDTGQALHEGKQDRYTPVSDHLHDSLRDALRQVIPSDEQYTATFDRFEFLLGMIGADLKAHNIEGIYVPSPVVGSYGWRYNDGRSQGPRDWIKTDLDSEEWKALPGGLFDGSVDRARAAFDTMSQAFDDAASRFF